MWGAVETKPTPPYPILIDFDVWSSMSGDKWFRVGPYWNQYRPDARRHISRPSRAWKAPYRSPASLKALSVHKTFSCSVCRREEVIIRHCKVTGYQCPEGDWDVDYDIDVDCGITTEDGWWAQCPVLGFDATSELDSVIDSWYGNVDPWPEIDLMTPYQKIMKRLNRG